MRINEITSRSTAPSGTTGSAGSKSLEVQKVNKKQTVLVDPKTKVKTIVPKDPNKPGAIKKNSKGEFELNTNKNSGLDSEIKPGDKVKAK